MSGYGRVAVEGGAWLRERAQRVLTRGLPALPSLPQVRRFNPAEPRDSEGRWSDGPGGVVANAAGDVLDLVEKLPPTEKPKVIPRNLPSVKDPVSGEMFWPNEGSTWQHSADLETRAGGVWSEYHDGMSNVRRIIDNRNSGKPDMDGVDPERGWLKQYQRVGEVQYGENGPRLGEVIQKGELYTRDDMGVDLRNAATVLQRKMAGAPAHKSPLYRGMRMNGKDLPKAGETFSTPISSWAKQRSTAEVFAYASEAPNLGVIGDHAVVMRMTGKKKSADIGGIVASGIMDDEHVASGTFRVKRVTRKGKTVNIEVEQVL
jgi:hypothetical protein